MYCTKCGTQHAEAATYCSNCGTSVSVAPAHPSYSIENDSGVRLLLPIGRSVWAIVAGYLGLVAIMILPAPLALFCGIMGIRDIRKNPEKHGMGRCIFAVIVGGLFTALLVLMISLNIIDSFMET